MVATHQSQFSDELLFKVQVKEVVMFPDGRLDPKNAAIYLGFAEKTLAIMRCNGDGPKFIKTGRIFYYLDDLNEWLGSFARIRKLSESE